MGEVVCVVWMASLGGCVVVHDGNAAVGMPCGSSFRSASLFSVCSLQFLVSHGCFEHWACRGQYQ